MSPILESSHSEKALKSFMVRLLRTSSNLQETEKLCKNYVLDCMTSPSLKITSVLTFLLRLLWSSFSELFEMLCPL